MKFKGKKICIVASSLGQGGAEKSAALLSVMLHNLGHDVFIASVLDHIDFPYKGTLYNLGALKKEKNGMVSRLFKLKKFKAFLTSNGIELIIDNRSRVQAYREFIITKIIYNVPTIYVIHSYKASTTFTPYLWLNKWLYKNEYMTAVSEGAKLKFQALFGLHNIRTIYNGFDFEDIRHKADEPMVIPKLPYILFYGRLDNASKNISLLLEAYKLSKLPNQAINLLILGNGPDADKLQTESEALNLGSHVTFKGFVDNPYKYVKYSKFIVLSSRYEGFPMVIPEALSLSIPVVSVNCQSGPNEVIVNGKNGLLVDNHNAKKLAEAMNEMAFNQELYKTCKGNASKSVAHLSINEISKSWNTLIQELSNE